MRESTTINGSKGFTKASCHKRRRTWTGCVLIGLFGAFAGCAEFDHSDERERGQAEAQRPAPGPVVTLGDAEDDAVIAVIALQPTDTTITLRQSQDGGDVALTEYAPVDAPSPLDFLVVGQSATPLEVFLAAAPADMQIPQALLADQERRVESDGAPEARFLHLTPPKLDADDAISHAANTYYYGADCSLASDGQSYFDGWWQALGWNFHWYNISAPNAAQATWTAQTPYRTQLRAHSCNGGTSSTYTFSVQRRSYGGCTADSVHVRFTEPGYRSVYYQTSGPSCVYQAFTAGHSHSGNSRTLGIMAP